MLSANGGIRSFGEAALLGEVACVAMALVATTALLAWLRRRERHPGRSGGAWSRLGSRLSAAGFVYMDLSMKHPRITRADDEGRSFIIEADDLI